MWQILIICLTTMRALTLRDCAGLVFGKLYSSNEMLPTATLAAFGNLFIGFAGRTIGFTGTIR